LHRKRLEPRLAVALVVNRPIRSFVLRQGRTTPAQQRALTELIPRYGLAFSDAPIDAQAIFKRKAPLILEIGSGMGEGTAAIAAAHPETDFIAVEVHGPGVGSLLNRIDSLQLQNLRVIRHDAVEVLERMIADGTLAALHVFFPDPWPKKRHHKRRLVQPGFVSLIARKLLPGAVVHLATDWPEYADHIASVFGASACFASSAAGLVARTATKFEQRGRRLGNPVRDLIFVRTKERP
jgi:tRNA (guanine-N7-)-methyltransferase